MSIEKLKEYQDRADELLDWFNGSDEPEWTAWELEELEDDSIGNRNDASSRQIGGAHYQKGVEPWDAMKAWLSDEEFEGYLRGNVIKYIARYKDKNGMEDLLKCEHYLQKLIEVTSNGQA